MNLTQIEKNFLKLIMIKYHDIVYAFSQENKSLKQSSENMSNLNFSLDKKYKLLLKENEEMKKVIASQIKGDNLINENNNNIKNNNNLNLNEINNNMYKSIKDMDFIICDNNNNQKEEKKEKPISGIPILNVDTKINSNKVELKEKNSNKNLEKNNNSGIPILNVDTEISNNKVELKEKNSNKNLEKNNISKTPNHKMKIDKFNKMNVKDLDSLYFNDKVNNINCQNSKKNYDKVPKIKFYEN